MFGLKEFQLVFFRRWKNFTGFWACKPIKPEKFTLFGPNSQTGMVRAGGLSRPLLVVFSHGPPIAS